MTRRAGFVGLGNIGAPMAARLVAAGLEIRVHDLAPAPVRRLVEAGAVAAPSPRALAEETPWIGVCVRDDEDVLAVCLGHEGLLAGAAPGAVVAVHSTVLPRTVEQVAAAAAERGVAVIDACISGGAAGAERGELLVMAGGEREHVERARPLLDAFAREVVHCGPLGNGAKAKLCNNLMTYLAWTAAYEARLLARAVGLSREVLETVTRGSGNLTEPMTRFLALHELPDEARSSEGMQALLRGHTAVAEKDLAATLQMAREAGVALPGAGLAAQIMARVYGVADERRR